MTNVCNVTGCGRSLYMVLTDRVRPMGDLRPIWHGRWPLCEFHLKHADDLEETTTGELVDTRKGQRPL